MVNVGIAGIGFMGMIHYLAYQKTAGARVTAIATRNETKRAGDWRGIKGNFGPEGTVMDLSGISVHATLEAMLDDPQVDVVDICLPPSMHAKASLAALNAGKHVLCEKPIALSTDEADSMVAAAAEAGRRLMIGHVLVFFPEYDYARRLVNGGEYGRLLGGHFKRIISDPTWLEDFFDPASVGGPMVDLHIHDAHFIRLLCGQPREVFSRGWMRQDVVEFATTQFTFDGDTAPGISASSGVIRQQGRPFTHGFEIYLERATLLYDFAVLGEKPHVAMPLTLLSDDGRVTQVDVGSGDPVDAFAAELEEVARSVATAEPSVLLDGVLARDALVLCQRQSESVREGVAVRV